VKNKIIDLKGHILVKNIEGLKGYQVIGYPNGTTKFNQANKKHGLIFREKDKAFKYANKKMMVGAEVKKTNKPEWFFEPKENESVIMKWYNKKINSIHDQSIIGDEETGQAIAVVYESKNGQLLASAPELLEALKTLEEFASSIALEDNSDNNLQAVRLRKGLSDAREAIQKAERED